jgi:anaerobic magnesium-protoporphyrin IX monomethyl ester cyclase
MARVMLVQPWNFHDEDIVHDDLVNEWRNAPYSIVLLGTMLRGQGHHVRVVDLIERLITNRGSLGRTLDRLGDEIRDFKPEIFGVGFFSIHYFEVQKLVQFARDVCRRAGLQTRFIAGGIHASTEPVRTLNDLDFDHVFIGEAEISLSKFCGGVDPKRIQGIIGRDDSPPGGPTLAGGRSIIPLETHAAGPARLGTLTFEHKAETLEDLDSLPYPDYSLVNYQFYAQPNRAKFRTFEAKSLDIIMGRGCVYRCAFCAYNALSSVRFHSAAYLAGEVEYLKTNFDIDSFYFMDSTIGNNQPLLYQLCDEFERRGLHRRIRWNGCMRPNQISRRLLTRLMEAGCWHLFYGFESGSERVLKLMAKDTKASDNEKAATLHRDMEAPYTASMLMGYPGEREEDILLSIDFIKRHKPPVCGFNWYIPLPGSPDYDRLKAQGLIDRDDPWEWRKIGEIASQARLFCDVPRDRFMDLYNHAQTYCNKLTHDYGVWGCIAPVGSAIGLADDAAPPDREVALASQQIL